MYDIVIKENGNFEQQAYTRKSDVLKNLSILFRAMSHYQSGISSIELSENGLSKLHIKHMEGTISDDFFIERVGISPVVVKDRALGYLVYIDGECKEVFSRIADLFKYLWR